MSKLPAETRASIIHEYITTGKPQRGIMRKYTGSLGGSMIQRSWIDEPEVLEILEAEYGIRPCDVQRLWEDKVSYKNSRHQSITIRPREYTDIYRP